MLSQKLLTNDLVKKGRAVHQSSTYKKLSVKPLRYQSLDVTKRNVTVQHGRPSSHSMSKAYAESEAKADPALKRFKKYMEKVPRPSHAEEGKTLVANGKYGVITTIKSTEPKGYPFGAIVQYTADEDCRPIFCISKLADHTNDLMQDSRASLSIQCEGFSGLTDARITITGDVTPVPEEELKQVKETFLKGHPKSFWITFGDFMMYRMEKVQTARYVGGFGMIGTISEADYAAAESDPVQQYSNAVCEHMNNDHADSLLLCMKGLVGFEVESARMTRIDKLGMDLMVTRNEQSMKARIVWPRPAFTRKQVRELMMVLVQEAQKRVDKQAADA